MVPVELLLARLIFFTAAGVVFRCCFKLFRSPHWRLYSVKMWFWMGIGIGTYAAFRGLPTASPFESPQSVWFGIDGILLAATPFLIWGAVASLIDARFRMAPKTYAIMALYIAAAHIDAFLGQKLSVIELWNVGKYAAIVAELVVVGILVAVAIHTAWLGIHQLSDDAVEPRRRTRLIITAAVCIGFGVSTFDRFHIGIVTFDDDYHWLDLIEACGILAGAVGFFRVIRPGLSDFFGSVDSEGSIARSSVELTSALQSLPNVRDGREIESATPVGTIAKNPSEPLERIEKELLELMERKAPYLDPELNLKGLSTQLETPEYLLRRVINKKLGFRNISTFLNGYRVKKAAELLTTPPTHKDKIFSIALEVGFSSLAPFNRAFKDAYAMTPSEYREKIREEAIQAHHS